MSLVLERDAVLAAYAAAAERRWVLPTFNAENQSTVEAILAAAKAYADRIGWPELPISVGITNRYESRPQELDKLIEDGNRRAQEAARQTMELVRQTMDLG
mgnify:CR=1 FL=1